MVLINDHDPKPLKYQLDAERTGQLDWKYIEQGPEIWKVEITKKINQGHRMRFYLTRVVEDKRKEDETDMGNGIKFTVVVGVVALFGCIQLGCEQPGVKKRGYRFSTGRRKGSCETTGGEVLLCGKEGGNGLSSNGQEDNSADYFRDDGRENRSG